MEAVVEELHAAFGWPLCAVARLTGDGEVESVAARGALAERRMETWRQSARLGLIGRALRERAPVWLGDVLAEPDYRLTEETQRGAIRGVHPAVGRRPAVGRAGRRGRCSPDAFGENEVWLLKRGRRPAQAPRCTSWS